MSVGAISGVGMGGAGMGSVGGTGSVAGAGSTAGAAESSGVATGESVVTAEMAAPGGGTILAGSIASSLESLQELFQGFDVASMLLTLMIMQAMEKGDEESSGSGMAVLLGMAMAGSLAQQSGSGAESGGAVEAAAGGSGASLDMTA